MTKEEMNMIDYLIDLHMMTKENGYCGIYSYPKFLDEAYINKLKKTSSTASEVVTDNENN